MQKNSTIINVVLAKEATIYCDNLENKIVLSKQLSQQFFRASTDAQRNELSTLNSSCPSESIRLAEILTTVASNFLSTDELKDCISTAGKGVDFSEAYSDRNAPNFAKLWPV